MPQSVELIVYTVTDLASSKALYSKFLGVEPYVESAYYVGFKTANLEIGLTPGTSNQESTTPTAFIGVSDIKTSLQALLDVGGQIQQEVKDVGGGMLVAAVKDANGNILGLRQSP